MVEAKDDQGQAIRFMTLDKDSLSKSTQPIKKALTTNTWFRI